MKSNKILVTDSLFIYPEHERQLASSGFEVVRLDKPKASEEELISALQGAVGYILGGIESVTSQVIASAPDLRAIAFTGSGYHEFIPGADAATKRGIAISAAVGGNADAVAEYAVTLTLALVRHLPELTTPGLSSFKTVKGFANTTVGVIGYGAIGKRYAAIATALGFNVLVAQNPTHNPDSETVSLDDLLMKSDIVSLHVSKPRGTGVLGETEIALLRDGSGIINTAFPDAVDVSALAVQLAAGRLYYAVDAALDLGNRPMSGHYIASNAQTAFNTSDANKKISDRATQSIINLLTLGDDKDLVNSEYSRYRM